MTEPEDRGRRPIFLRVTLLLVLTVVGSLLLYPNWPLNFLSLFSKRVDDPESIERVKEQVANPEQMAEQAIDDKRLSLPEGFGIEKIVSGRGALRMMDLSPDGYILVTEKDRGNVLAYKPTGGDPQVAVSGLSGPSGITFRGNELWVAEETRILKFTYLGDGRVEGKQIVISGIPSGGHNTRTIGFGPDGKLYVAIGSSCNVCEESDKRRAAIVRYNADGTGEEIFAEGLRNTVGFVWHPETDEIWGTDNGRDLIGDDLPPEEVNIIKQGPDRAGKHYGWPYCYGRGVPNAEYKDRGEYCKTTEFPAVEMQAHSAPLGLRFYTGSVWPERYHGNLFVAFHGSWNRTEPTGYKIVRVDKELKVHDFITGWLEPNGKAWGRPVDILFIGEDMYITDDGSGSIYKVTYTG